MGKVSGRSVPFSPSLLAPSIVATFHDFLHCGGLVHGLLFVHLLSFKTKARETLRGGKKASMTKELEITPR